MTAFNEPNDKPATLVVKLGGGEGLDVRRCVDDLATLARARPLVVVHGVSAVADRLAAARGVLVRTLTSPAGYTSRYTDPAMRDIYVEAAEQVNAGLVEALRARGLDARGLTGAQIAIAGARKGAIRAVVNGRVRLVHDDYTGSITGVDAARLLALLEAGRVPVVPPLASSTADGLLNIDGDRAAAMIAAALGAGELVILSNVRGLYRNFPDEASFVEFVPAAQIARAMDWAQGRMKRKVLGAQEALNGGVPRVIIGDGRAANPVTHALNGGGTVFAA